MDPTNQHTTDTDLESRLGSIKLAVISAIASLAVLSTAYLCLKNTIFSTPESREQYSQSLNQSILAKIPADKMPFQVPDYAELPMSHDQWTNYQNNFQNFFNNSNTYKHSETNLQYDQEEVF